MRNSLQNIKFDFKSRNLELADYSLYSLKELIILIKDDDLKAFDQVYHRMLFKVYGFLNKIYHDQDLVEEVTQEVFIKVWENRMNINEENSVENYIFTIAKNRIYDHLQKERRKLEIYKKAEIQITTNTLEENVIYNDLQDNINKIINNLPESQRKIFTMSRQDYLSNKQIAAQLNISERTVENQIYKVLKKLKKELSENDTILPLFLVFLLF